MPTLCYKNDNEDEYRLISKYPIYYEFGKKYMKKYYYKGLSMFQFVQLFNNSTSIKIFVIFLQEIIKLKVELLSHFN